MINILYIHGFSFKKTFRGSRWAVAVYRGHNCHTSTISCPSTPVQTMSLSDATVEWGVDLPCVPPTNVRASAAGRRAQVPASKAGVLQQVLACG